MATTIDQQVALDEALVPSTQRLRIEISYFRLPSDIQSKESTLQVVYDVLRNSPFFRAFQVTTDVPEIYMQEFWATAKLHHNSIRFKMDTKKSVLDLEAFIEMLHISPRIPSQTFAKMPFEEEIREFLRNLGHSDDIRHLTDVNVNKLYQAWRSFASVINKCLTGKSSGIDNVPSDDSEEELSWNSFDDEKGDEQTKGREESEGDKTDESDDGSDDGNDDDDDETVKDGSEKLGKGGDEVSESEGESDEEETRQEKEESFDPIPRTP
nr:hypothetical protein [Tanacetum cinerariifolium]